MARTKSYPRARLITAAFDKAVEEQGRILKWIAQQAGVSANRLNDYRNGLEMPYARAVLIANVLGREVVDLFDVVQAPPQAETGRAA